MEELKKARVVPMRGEEIMKAMEEMFASGELKMTEAELRKMLEDMAKDWDDKMGWFYRDVLNRNWRYCFEGLMDWTSFFSGPLAGFSYIERALVKQYGLPPACAHGVLPNRIMLNPANNQYVLSITDSFAKQMGFSGLPGFVAATDLPTLLLQPEE